MRRAVAFPLALTVLIGSLVVGIAVGPAGLSPSEVWSALRGGEGPARTILLSLRLPRALAAALAGAGLAVSGAVFQALLRNPLAEPYLLGVSAGAAFGAVGAMGLGLASTGSAALPVAALAGSLMAIAIVFRVAWVIDRLDTRILLLAGVVTSAFFGACVLLILTFASPQMLRSAIFWTLGSLSGASWPVTAVLAGYVVPAAVAVFAMSRHLNALALGEETAASLGTEVERTKTVAYLLASLLAAATVAVAGVIGFVGLVVPHAVRLVWGADHRVLIPLAFLAGGSVLVLTDAVARTAASPQEIPVGVVTAFLGVPFFLALLRRRYGR
jgi:iron complex transport system permease protein